MRIRADLLSTPPRLDPVAAYLAAAACAVAAGLVGAILGSFYEGVAPFATFYPAIFLAAFVGGFGPGAVCCLLSWALAWWLWIREGGTVESGGINFLLFTASALLLAAAADFVRKILARLAASERRFKAAQEASLDPFLILSAVRDEAGEACDFRIAFANAAAARSLGDSVEGLTGRRLSEVRAAVLGKPGIFARYREVLDTGMAHLAEIPYRDGEAAGWVRNQAVRLEDGLAVTYRDVTEARERQEALAESEQRARKALAELAAIYVTAPIGLALLDNDLRYRRINPLLAELNGLPPDAHIGRTLAEIVPDVAEAAERDFRRVIETGEPLRQLEIMGRTRARPGEIRTWIEDANPLVSDTGRVEGLVVSVVDISDRKRAEAALAESQERLQQLAAAIDDVLYISEPTERRLLYINGAYERIWGRPADDLLQDLRALHDTIHPDDRPAVMAAFIRELSAGGFDMEYRIVRPDGEVRWIRDRGFPVARSTSAGTPRVAGVASDITERKQTEEARTLLMREVDHRAKNVLAVVLALVRLTKASDVEAFRQILGGRIASLAQVHSLLAAEKWTGAGLRSIAEAELAAYAGRSELRGPSILLSANAAQSLALACHELSTNAAKHGALSAPEGRVTLSWWTDRAGALHITWVERGGPPVQPPARRGFGTVLLEQATRYQLGADLAFDWSGEGLQVTLKIPRERYVGALADAVPEEVTAGLPSRPLTSGPRRVLVVEDNGLVAVETAQNLRDIGCQVIGPEASVEAAVRRVHDERVLDAAVLDLDLDGELALPVAEALAERGVPFLLCTGFSDAASRGGAFDGRPVLNKPVRPERLAEALEALLGVRYR